jgi:hypothetical protein
MSFELRETRRRAVEGGEHGEIRRVEGGGRSRQAGISKTFYPT